MRPAICFSLLLLGCGQSPVGPQICDRPEAPEPIEYREGICRGDTFMSADWDDELLHYPGGAYYRIFHRLGEVPAEIDCWLSFRRRPGDEEDNPLESSMGPGVGNQCQIQEANADYIEVLNATCSEYYLLLTARAGGALCAD